MLLRPIQGVLEPFRGVLKAVRGAERRPSAEEALQCGLEDAEKILQRLASFGCFKGIALHVLGSWGLGSIGKPWRRSRTRGSGAWRGRRMRCRAGA